MNFMHFTFHILHSVYWETDISNDAGPFVIQASNVHVIFAILILSFFFLNKNLFNY